MEEAAEDPEPLQIPMPKEVVINVMLPAPKIELPPSVPVPVQKINMDLEVAFVRKDL